MKEKKLKRGGSDYYDYIAVERDGKRSIRRFKLEVEYALGREINIYKLLPLLFEFLLSKKDTLVSEFIFWAGNRIATIYKQETRR